MKSSKGFTLIELVIVIVVLGILAATAVPKFIDIQSNAKESVLVSYSGALKSSVNMIKYLHIISGEPDQLIIDDAELSFFDQGFKTKYPVAITAIECSVFWNTVVGGVKATAIPALNTSETLLTTYSDNICTYNYDDFGLINYTSGSGEITSSYL